MRGHGAVARAAEFNFERRARRSRGKYMNSSAHTHELLPREGQVTVGLSSSDRFATDCVADLGTLHPSSHGMCRLRLTINNGVITAADPVIGQMHRGVEKLFESRDYRQVLLMVDRHDWLSPVGSEIGAAMCMEFMLGIEVSRRAQLLRMIAAELSRVAANAMYISEFPMSHVATEIAQSQQWQSCVRDWRALRHSILNLLANLTGARVHVMWNVIGGVQSDADSNWCAAAHDVVAIGDLTERTLQVATCDTFTQRLRGVGAVTANTVRHYAVSGLVARSAGVATDVRRAPGYLLYNEFPPSNETFFKSTDCAHGRFGLLISESSAAAHLVGVLLHALADTPGPIDVQLPKTVRLPEGVVYRETENAIGANGFLLVSAGNKMPYRLKINSASFNTVSALATVLQGLSIEDLIPTLATIPFIAGDSDR